MLSFLSDKQQKNKVTFMMNDDNAKKCTPTGKQTEIFTIQKIDENVVVGGS